MRLLYIMLRVWPHHRFNIDFIISVCLALKRELPIMDDAELKTVFRIASVRGPENPFEGKILLDLQNSVLNRVIGKWEARS